MRPVNGTYTESASGGNTSGNRPPSAGAQLIVGGVPVHSQLGGQRAGGKEEEKMKLVDRHSSIKF